MGDSMIVHLPHTSARPKNAEIFFESVGQNTVIVPGCAPHACSLGAVARLDRTREVSRIPGDISSIM